MSLPGLIAGGRESNERTMTHQNREKYTITVSGKLLRTPSTFWVNSARAQDKGLRFWQTRTNAVIVHNSLPADCKVTSQQGERTFFERLSTPRPAPKIVLESALQSQQQQQQDTSESAASSRTRQLVWRVEREQRRDQGNSTNDPQSSRSESAVEKEPQFKVDLRIGGIAQDVILKDEERTVKIREVVKKAKRWFIHEICSGRSGKNPENSRKISEESSRIIP